MTAECLKNLLITHLLVILIRTWAQADLGYIFSASISRVSIASTIFRAVTMEVEIWAKMVSAVVSTTILTIAHALICVLLRSYLFLSCQHANIDLNFKTLLIGLHSNLDCFLHAYMTKKGKFLVKY